tara:strand:- start:24217 stop:26247 length:2031 start_codon:yes stop_codon:yes gene_type:complete
MKTLAIIQARSTSKRFPNKVLKKINKLSVLEILIKRLKQSKGIDKIIVAIPKSSSQKQLKSHLKKIKINIFEGSENNVLDRFYQATKKYKPKFIVRITADCPLIEPKIVDKLINVIKNKNFDYVSNVFPPTFPDGLDVSVMTYKTLEYAWKKAKTKHDKEHVVTYIQREKKFKKFNLINEKDLSLERWTLDDKNDFEVIKKIVKNFRNFNFDWKCILKLKKQKPEIFFENNHIARDEGSMKKINKGQIFWKRAKKIIPGGNMFLSKRPQLFLPGKWPTYFKKAKGCEIWGFDNIKYLDMSLMGVGTNILGYAHPEVDLSVKKTIEKGNMSSLNCTEEVYLSERLIKLHPWADMVKLTRSGGEANAVAIRIARAATKKQKIAVCGYHGWHDWYLAANLNKKKNLQKHLLPDLEINGVPKSLKNSVFTFDYNDLDTLKKILKEQDIAAVKMEVSRNEKPKNNFLKEVRRLTQSKGILLIFDECTSGFRENYGGLHLTYNVTPDIAIFGKALGNGYAINAIIGKKNVMNYAQTSFISSTFWTERIGPTAALKTLEVMKKINSWRFISSQGAKVKKRWISEGKKNNLNINTWGLDALAGFTIKSRDSQKYKTFISQEMLKKNILASNSIYFSIKHSDKILEKYFYYLDRIFKTIGECEEGRDINSLLETPISESTFRRLN